MHILHMLVLLVVALVAMTLLGITRKPRRSGRIFRMANAVPPPYSSGTHKCGRVTAFADAAIAVRFSLIAIGVSEGSVKSFVTGTADFPLGIVDDTTDTLTNDLTIPVHYDVLGGGVDKTLRVAIQSNVAYGDWIISDTNNGIYGMTDPATGGVKVFRLGRALHSAIANDPMGVEIAVLPQIVQH